MTPAERAVINAAIRYAYRGDTSVDFHNALIDAIDALKHDDGCTCPTDERVYCESSGCRGGDDFPPELTMGEQLEQAGRDAAPILAAGLHNALARLSQHSDAPTWHPLTMWHVRPGDRVRPAGNLNPEAEITVTARWWPPTDDARGRGSWHVIPGEKHWDDHVVQHGECVVELNGDGRARFFPPEMEIEILIAPAEVAAIEALGGWEQRA